MTDEELCELARNGDAEAWNALLSKYDRVARFEARQFFAPGTTSDDLFQEARFGFIKAVRDYRAEQGYFGAFARLCIKRQIITALKTAMRGKHAALNSAFSIDSPLDRDDDTGRTLEDILADRSLLSHDEALSREELAQTIRDAIMETAATELSDSETWVVALYLEGMSYSDTARAMGKKNTKFSDNCLNRAKKKLMPRIAEAVRVALGE